AFCRYHWRHGPKRQRLKSISWVDVVVLGVVSMPVGFELVLLGELTSQGILLLILLGVLFLVMVLTPQLAERYVRRIYKGSEGKGEFRRRCLSLSPEGLHTVSEVTDSLTKWPAIEKIAVTDEHLFLYISLTQAIIVPKRAFDAEWRFTDFVEHAR